jgi:hypothetical protein
MEFSLHRQLKDHYAGSNARCEVPVEGYRIDVVDGVRLVEIQYGSLAAIRDKVRSLLKRHEVCVVKPLVTRKLLVKKGRRNGRVANRRWSPKRAGIFDLFDELVYFTNVFPHERLTLQVPLIEIEEWRYPGHGRRRWRRPGDHQVEDQRLLRIIEEQEFRRAADFGRLLPVSLPRPFHTGQLAEQLAIPRWVAQRVAYFLRKTGVLTTIGKQGNAWLYEANPSHC